MKRYLVKPFGSSEYLQNRFFVGPYGVLREHMADRGVQLDTYDMGELAKVDGVVLFNYDEDFYRKCLAAGMGREQLVLMAMEPRVVIPEQYEPEIWDRFGRVFTFLEDRVDGERILPLRYPQAQPVMEKLPGWTERKHVVLINANKYSHVPNELYSLRRRAIRHFERSRDGFDLYGFGWEQGSRILNRDDAEKAFRRGKPVQFLRDLVDGRLPYPSYKGSVEDKYGTMAGYRFSLCFENEKEAPGYVTEKIFDSLACGTVPVYFGAPNITDYVPAEAMVDLREFRNLRALERYLRSVDEAEWTRMHQAGQDYLRSEEHRRWRPEGVFSEMAEVLAQ